MSTAILIIVTLIVLALSIIALRLIAGAYKVILPLLLILFLVGGIAVLNEKGVFDASTTEIGEGVDAEDNAIENTEMEEVQEMDDAETNKKKTGGWFGWFSGTEDADAEVSESDDAEVVIDTDDTAMDVTDVMINASSKPSRLSQSGPAGWSAVILLMVVAYCGVLHTRAKRFV